MSVTLSIEDSNLLDYITNSNTIGIEYECSRDVDILITHSNISGLENKKVLYKNIKILLEKFNLIWTNSPTIIDEYICSNIAGFIVTKLMHTRYLTEFPDDIMTPAFIDFLVKEKKFFTKYNVGTGDTLFNKLLGLETNYFSLKFNSQYLKQYIVHTNNLTAFIKKQLLSFVILNKYELSITLNFLELMRECDKYTPVDNNFKILQDALYKLYIVIYNGVANMKLINLDTVNFYKLHVNSSETIDLEKSIKYYGSLIDKLKTFIDFRTRLLDNIVNFNIRACTDNEIETIASMCNKNTYVGEDFDKFIKIFTPILINIVKSDTINLHNKIRIIMKNEILDIDFIKPLVEIFIELQKYDINTGFKFKLKTRSKILDILNILSKKKFEEKLKTNIFITLCTNHLNELINTLVELNTNFKTYASEHNRLLIIKYTIYFQQSIHLLHILYENITDSDLLYFKLIEFLFTFMNCVEKGQLSDYVTYNISPENTVNECFSKNFNSMFETVFSNLDIYSKNKSFIDIWSINKYFYNEPDIETAIIKYGEFKINDDLRITDILKYVSNNIKSTIEFLELNTDKYTTDVPDKFMDAIMFNEIKNPIEIPSVEQIVDKYTIYNHLYFNQTNPFTNEELSILTLEEYNSLPEVKDRVTKFSEDFRIWKLKYKKN